IGGSVLQEHRRSWQHAEEGNCPSLASYSQQREKIVRKTSLHLPGSLPSMGPRQSIQAQDAISTSRTYSPKGTSLPFLHRCSITARGIKQGRPRNEALEEQVPNRQ